MCFTLSQAAWTLLIYCPIYHVTLHHVEGIGERENPYQSQVSMNIFFSVWSMGTVMLSNHWWEKKGELEVSVPGLDLDKQRAHPSVSFKSHREQ